MKYFLLLTSVFLFFIFFTQKASAQSDYVLPYPSAMPGSSFYKIHLILEKLMQYWYFGNLGQFKYTLKESDKYLVEAKTLFEYKQYLLAVKALEESDLYFAETDKFLIKAQLEGKDILINKQILRSASEKHKEVLRNLIKDVPTQFLWKPEKENATQLNLIKTINNSIKIRK